MHKVLTRECNMEIPFCKFSLCCHSDSEAYYYYFFFATKHEKDIQFINNGIHELIGMKTKVRHTYHLAKQLQNHLVRLAQEFSSFVGNPNSFFNAVEPRALLFPLMYFKISEATAVEAELLIIHTLFKINIKRSDPTPTPLKHYATLVLQSTLPYDYCVFTQLK